MSTNLILLPNTKLETITSLELLNQINLFRNQIEGKKELRHDTLLNIIRDEFEEEVNAQKLLDVEYQDKKGESRPMFTLTISQAKQVLIRESKVVRRAVIKKLKTLELQLSNSVHIAHLQKKILELETKKTELSPSATCLSDRLLNLLRRDSKYENEANHIREEMELQRRVAGNCYKLDDNMLTVNQIMDRLKVKPWYKKELVECLEDHGYTKAGNKFFGVECMFW